MSNFPSHKSADYKERHERARLIYALGEVIIEQYGKEESVKLLAEYEKKKLEEGVKK